MRRCDGENNVQRTAARGNVASAGRAFTHFFPLAPLPATGKNLARRSFAQRFTTVRGRKRRATRSPGTPGRAWTDACFRGFLIAKLYLGVQGAAPGWGYGGRAPVLRLLFARTRTAHGGGMRCCTRKRKYTYSSVRDGVAGSRLSVATKVATPAVRGDTATRKSL
jgi:hypothetical protein